VAGNRLLHVVSLGTVPYAEALELQRAAARARLDGRLDQDLLFLLEHPPVVTTGRSTKSGNLLLSSDALAKRGIELFDVERGGDVTFHGPGQLVGYPIIDLKRHKEDLHWYLRQVEQVLIDALGSLGITADRNPGKTGVWTREKTQWVTWHGFALNVTTDLSYFDVMVPCGIAEVTMTSVERELLDGANGPCLAVSPALGDETREAVVEAAAKLFSLHPVAIGRDDIDATLREAQPQASP
jgi:lipoate-protein ligase B